MRLEIPRPHSAASESRRQDRGSGFLRPPRSQVGTGTLGPANHLSPQVLLSGASILTSQDIQTLAAGLCPAQPERAQELLSAAVERLQGQAVPSSRHLVLVLDKVRSWPEGSIAWPVAPSRPSQPPCALSWQRFGRVLYFLPRTSRSCHGKACPTSGPCLSPGCPPSASY